MIALSLSLSSCAQVNPNLNPNVGTVERTESTKTTSTVRANDQSKVTVDQTTSTVRTDQADQVVVNNVSFIYLLLLALGWLAPSPNELGRMVRSLFSRKKE